MKALSIARTGLVFFCLLILAGSSVPGAKIPSVFELTPDKLIHCAEYFVLGLAIIYWLSHEFSIQKNHQLILITIFIGSAFGILDENYQRLTPGRTPDVWDWVLDTIGVLIAAFVGNYFINKKEKANKKTLQ
jgi:VanZ family protein